MFKCSTALNPSLFQALTRVTQLEKWALKMESEEAESAAHGMEMLRAVAKAGRLYDLILLDKNMPELDGMGFARCLQEAQEYSNIPVIMLTSVAQEGDMWEADQIGIAGYLSKPVRQRHLFDCIAKVLHPVETIVPEDCKIPYLDQMPRFEDVRILVAEDNNINQEVVREILTTWDCQVEIAPNGRRAVDALTANALEGDREVGLAAGMDDFVSKPFEQEQLHTVIEKWLAVRVQQNSNRSESMVENSSNNNNHQAGAGEVLEAKALDTLRSMQRPGQPSLLAKVIGIYLNNGPDRMQALKDAIAQDDPSALAFAAHGFKSDSANLGATALAELLRDLEMIGRSETTENAGQILTQVKAEYTKACAALQAIQIEVPVGS